VTNYHLLRIATSEPRNQNQSHQQKSIHLQHYLKEEFINSFLKYNNIIIQRFILINVKTIEQVSTLGYPFLKDAQIFKQKHKQKKRLEMSRNDLQKLNKY
jgi:hypothetical protein